MPVLEEELDELEEPDEDEELPLEPVVVADPVGELEPDPVVVASAARALKSEGNSVEQMGRTEAREEDLGATGAGGLDGALVAGDPGAEGGGVAGVLAREAGGRAEVAGLVLRVGDGVGDDGGGRRGDAAYEPEGGLGAARRQVGEREARLEELAAHDRRGHDVGVREGGRGHGEGGEGDFSDAHSGCCCFLWVFLLEFLRLYI